MKTLLLPIFVALTLYNWVRFGQCRLTAHTWLDGQIQKIELEGTGQGCNVYLQKLGG